MREYIHYGDSEYRPELLRGITEKKNTRPYWKPAGLWASPLEGLTWKIWCEDEDFYTERLNESFRFVLKEEAKILHLHKLEDAEPYFKWETYCPTLDIKKLYKQFDGVELHISEDYKRFHFNNVFYTWDVDSICIWNPDIIIPEERS